MLAGIIYNSRTLKEVFYKNTKVNFTDTGKGTVIVFLHGFLENHKMWNYFIPTLSRKNRIITIDLLGHGATGCLGYIHTMADMADAVYCVLSELKIRKAIFIGHSMGGYVALAFATLYSENVKGIVLLNSTAKPDSEERKQNRDRAIKAVKQNYTNFISLSIGNLFSLNNRERLHLEIENVKEEALKTPLQGIIAALEGMKIREDKESLLRFASYPILIILGKKDPVLNYEETIEQIRGTQVQLVSLADGHMSAIENKEETLEALVAFVKKI